MHPAQASRGDLTAIASYDPVRVWGRVVRRSTHRGRWSRRLVCPLVLGVCCRRLRLRGSPDHVSALSRPGTSPGVRPVIHGDQLEGLAQLPWFPAAFPPPAFASWSSCSRQGIGPSSRSAYRTRGSGPRRGFHVPHARATTGVGAFISRGRRCSPRLATITSPRPPLLNGTSLHPATTTIHARLRLTKHQRGFKQFTRPIFASPVAPGWNGSPWAFPRASHPALAGDARRGGDRPSSTDPKQRSMSST